MKKFELIYYDLKAKIQSGHYPVSSLLPSEHDLCVLYDVSRGTIRQSLKKLELHGYIHKRQGKGNIVLDHSAFTLPISGIKSYKEIARDHDLNVKTHLILNERVKTPQIIQEKINVPADEEFIHLIRLREIEGNHLIIDEDYLRASFIPSITQEIAEDSIYKYFEEDLDLVISYAHKEFFAQKANELDQKYFNLKKTDHVMTVNSFVYLGDTSFFQFTSSRHQLESFKFEEIARRH